MIASVLLRQFAIAIERRDHPALATSPVILSAPERVYAASDEARAAGVTIGLSLRHARLLCPVAQVFPAQVKTYRAAFEHVVSLLAEFTHLIEPDSDLMQHKLAKKRKRDAMPADRERLRDAIVYLNLEGLKPEASAHLARTISERLHKKTGLTPSIGLAAGKFPALIAALSTESGTIRAIRSGQEASFLAEQLIDRLLLDIETERRLRLFGVETVGQLAQLPAGAVATQFGKAGRLLHQLSAGRDLRPVIPVKFEATMSITHELDGAVQDRLVLESVLRAMAQDMTVRLRMDGKMARRVVLTVQMEQSSEVSRELVLRHPTWDRDHLAATFIDMLTHLVLRSSVAAFEVRLSDFVPATGRQLDLFPGVGSQDKLFRETLTDVINRYGISRFYWLTIARRQSRVPGSTVEFMPVDQR